MNVDVEELAKTIVNLDIGCGENKQPNFLGMDKRPLPGVDIIHDLEVFPYPIEDEKINTIVGSHIVEHIKPWLMIDFMNELWRILRVGGQVAFGLPYGYSYGFLQDPTHCNSCVEATWDYFCPQKPLYKIYRPKPFTIDHCTWQATGNMEVLLKKITEDEGKEYYDEMVVKHFGEQPEGKELSDSQKQ